MSRYRLMPREGTQTFHKIMCGRKWVGRVTQHDDGDWLGIMGKTMIRRPTKGLAFDDIVAQHLGYKSGAELRQRNASIRQAARLANQAADYIASEYFRGNSEPMNKALDSNTEIGLGLVVRGMTRELGRTGTRSKRR